MHRFATPPTPALVRGRARARALARVFALAITLTGAFAAHPAAAQRPPIDLEAFAPQADTFAFRVNGQTIGTQVVSLTATADGFLFRETTTTPAGSQSTEVRMDAGGGMRSVLQRGEMAGQVMRIDVAYAGGRATGDARVPGPQGMQEGTVEAAVPADVIDDNVLTAFLPALSWTANATFELPVFSAGKNELAVHTFRVMAEEDVTVPAGSQRAYRVEVTGGAQPLVLHLSTTAPHRLLRLEVIGTPLALVRTGPSGS